MKKQVINFNEAGYKEAVNLLDDLIAIINDYSDKVKITVNDIKLMTIPKMYETKCYLNELKNICDNIGIDYEIVSTFEYTMKNDMFQLMALNKTKVNYQLSEIVRSLLVMNEYLADSKYIEIDSNGIASKTINADDSLKEHFTDYTTNEKQNKILEVLDEIKPIISKLQELGIYKTDVGYMFGNDFNIIPQTFYQLTEKL